jgi:hypothetical protein
MTDFMLQIMFIRYTQCSLEGGLEKPRAKYFPVTVPLLLLSRI